MLPINNNYKTQQNNYETQEAVTLITVLKKNGEELIAKIDTADLEKVQNAGIWFAEWNKDFNTYLVQNISLSKLNKKSKPLKQSLQSFILDLDVNIPIKNINKDTLDNRKCNLEVVEQNTLNKYIKIDEDTIAIILKDKYGNAQAKALISPSDLDEVVTEEYTWVYYKTYNQISVVANTPKGRIPLDELLMVPADNMKIHHINLNPLDNKRTNLELVAIDED